MHIRMRGIVLCAVLMTEAMGCARELPTPRSTALQGAEDEATGRTPEPLSSEALPSSAAPAAEPLPVAPPAAPAHDAAQLGGGKAGLPQPSTGTPLGALATREERAGESEVRRRSVAAKAMVAAAPVQVAGVRSEPNTEAYAAMRENDFMHVADAPLSTFSIDVDTASYSNVRRFLADGQLPPPDAVRVEELVNYFRYAYPEPDGAAPFSTYAEVGPCPWNPGARLVHVGLKAKSLAEAAIPPRNLVFLLDVSGSMQSPDKLPLLKRGMALLAERLRPQDHVAIVVYAGSSGVVLAPTSDRAEVLAALSRLEAGGSTNGGEGIELAYRVATSHFDPKGINRVILATDGDFNVGVTSEGALVRMIEEKRKTGVYLTVLGFGTGNLKDAQMEQLADKGNGNYAYIDSLAEAQKVLVREAGSTLVTVAKDVKLQVEWNPAQVESYRLVGYENRALAARDFNDDSKDAGELGAGHTVTALYEVVPRGTAPLASEVDPLRYQGPRAPAAELARELLTLKVRYKLPSADKSALITRTLGAPDTLGAGSPNFQFSAAVAGFGQLLRRSPHVASLSLARVRELAKSGAADDPHGDRKELLELISTAERLGLGG